VTPPPNGGSSGSHLVKPALARHVRILHTRKNERVMADIEDDGRGFDPGASFDGSGLDGMGERVALLDPRLQVESAPETGTTIVVEVPST
jgi:two-component system sensor histidine kinase DegS